jgi:LuxR family maltose regulon positive regulatory protein
MMLKPRPLSRVEPAFCPLERPQLCGRLEELEATHDVVVIAAPGGYGKSLLLREYFGRSADQALFVSLPPRGDVVDVVRAIVSVLDIPWVQGVSTALEDGLADEGSWLTRCWLVDRITESDAPRIALDDVGRCLPRARGFLSELVADVTSVRWYLAVHELTDISVSAIAAQGRCAFLERDALAFDLAETTALARKVGISLDLAECRKLLESTSGWPVAVALALQNPAAPFVGGIPSGARDVLGRYVEERVLSALSPIAQGALSWAPYFSKLDAGVLSSVGVTDGTAALKEIRPRLPLTRTTERGFVVHDVVLDRLRDIEERRSSTERAHRWLVAGDAMRAEGDAAEALRAYERAGAVEPLVDLLASDGDVLIDRGYVADVSRALSFVHGRSRDVSALALVEANVEALRGRMDRAEELLRRALDGTARTARTAAVRLSTHLVNRGRTGGAEILARFVAGAPDDTDVQSAYAVALGAVGRTEEARRTALRTAELLRKAADDHVAARGWQRVGLTHHFAGDRALARDCCEAALEIALRDGLAGEVARIRSLLCSIAVAEDDDALVVREAEAMASAARRAAMPQVELAALTTLLEDAAQRGDDEAFARYDAEFAGKGSVRGWADVFPYALAKAMGEVARGSLAPARERMLRIVRDAQEPGDILAAATAVAALLSSRLEPNAVRHWMAALRNCVQTLSETPRGETAHTATLTFTIAAFMEAGFGQGVRAQRAAGRARDVARTRREHALAQAAHAAIRHTPTRDRDEALELLDAAGLRGYGRLLRVSRLEPTPADEPQLLSELERELLRAYCERRTAKEIALETGRNVYTVRTHVRNISRKLGANGRDELIAIATARRLL